MNHSLKFQLVTVCQNLYLGDGTETTYSQVTVNCILNTIALSFRSGADGSFSTTSSVMGFGTFGMLICT